jgi:hypothetical protein
MTIVLLRSSNAQETEDCVLQSTIIGGVGDGDGEIVGAAITWTRGKPEVLEMIGALNICVLLATDIEINSVGNFPTKLR